MTSELSKFECFVAEKRFTLLCEGDAQLWQLKEALFQFSKHAGKMEDQIAANIQTEQALKEAIHITEDVSTEIQV